MTEFARGDKVIKVGGDYRFSSIVVAAFEKLSGNRRYVVEDDRGILHIFSEANLKPELFAHGKRRSEHAGSSV